jgi:NitT/TauT family transport system substrate-binding protein
MKRFGAGWLAVAVFLVLLTGLAAGPAAAQTKLVVATPHALLFDSGLVFAVGKEKGFFKDAGLDVETVVVRGGGENVQSVVSGSVQIALATGFFSVLSAFQKGAPIRVLAAEMTGVPDIFWYSLGSSPYRKMEDLAGKRIAFSNPGSSSHMAVLAVIEALKAKGLPAPQAISLGGMPDALTGVKTGQADAGFAVPPLFFDQIEKGDLRIVFRGSEIQKFNDVTIRVTFANASFVERNPDTVRAFFRAYQRSMDFMFENRQETAKIWIRHGKLKLGEAMVLKALDFYPRSAVAFRPVKGVSTTIEDAIRFNFLKQPLSQAELERLIDLRYLP